jgi:hypothetical protein
MANEPVLVKKDGERMTPADAPMSRSEFLAAVQMIVGGQQAASDTANAKTDAVVDALQHIRSDINKGEYNIANFPNISAFNPRGENKTVGGRPRPPLKGEIAWVGTPVVWHEQTYDEIQLLNQIEAGTYHNGEWTVRDMTPGVKGSRKLLVTFPCKTHDERANLPSGYWDYNAKNEDGTAILGDDLNEPTKRGRRVTGMEVMLREMVEEAKSRQAVSA